MKSKKLCLGIAICLAVLLCFQGAEAISVSISPKSGVISNYYETNELKLTYTGFSCYKYGSTGPQGVRRIVIYKDGSPTSVSYTLGQSASGGFSEKYSSFTAKGLSDGDYEAWFTCGGVKKISKSFKLLASAYPAVTLASGPSCGKKVSCNYWCKPTDSFLHCDSGDTCVVSANEDCGGKWRNCHRGSAYGVCQAAEPEPQEEESDEEEPEKEEPKELPPCAKSGGNDIYNGGWVTGPTKTRSLSADYPDSCVSNEIVKEWYCGDDGYAAYNELPCGAGYACQTKDGFGSCVASATSRSGPSCQDPDAANEFVSKGITVQLIDGKIQGQYTDRCESGKIREFYCSGNLATNKLVSCPTNTICKDGACIGETCTDSDGGDVLTVKGTATSQLAVGTTTGTDACLSTTQLTEWNCVSNNAAYYTATCPSGTSCSDGACVATTATGSAVSKVEGSLLSNFFSRLFGAIFR